MHVCCLPKPRGKALRAGGCVEAHGGALLSCDIRVGVKGVLTQGPASSCVLPALPCQHTPQAKKAGDEILLPSTIRDGQLLTAG